MGRFRLTLRAEQDLLAIAEYTRRTWGDQQCALYLGQLEGCCQELAGNPALGRQCDSIRPGLRRRGQGKHTIYYRPEGDDVLVVRILHERMLPELHLVNDDEE